MHACAERRVSDFDYGCFHSLQRKDKDVGKFSKFSVFKFFTRSYLCVGLLVSAEVFAASDLPLTKIQLPPGFKIELLARVPNARAMAVSPKGTLFVGSRQGGNVYAVIRKNLKVQEVVVLSRGQKQPAGVAFADGDLYFSSIDKIWRLPGVEKNLKKPPRPVLVSDKFPSETHHGWKYIGFGPDGKLYVPVGAPCNVCARDARYANIMRMNKDGSDLEVFAFGIRNTVGFAWQPKTHELWFTENGRDLLGDDVPPDELNRAPRAGMDFGFPFCHGGTILDPEFGQGKNCANYTAPVQLLAPHGASLGMTFYTGKMFPAEYRDQIFIAEHGSWNRSKKSGYRISLVKLNGDKAVSYTPFAQGWLENESNWGRPVDVLVDLDGALLISDDDAGAIYRVSYSAK